MLRSYKLFRLQLTEENCNEIVTQLITYHHIYIHVNNTINVISIENTKDVCNILNMCYNWLQNDETRVKIIAGTLQIDVYNQDDVLKMLTQLY